MVCAAVVNQRVGTDRLQIDAGEQCFIGMRWRTDLRGSPASEAAAMATEVPQVAITGRTWWLIEPSSTNASPASY